MTRTDYFLWIAFACVMLMSGAALGVYARTTPIPPEWKWCAQMHGTLFYPRDRYNKPYCVRLEEVP